MKRYFIIALAIICTSYSMEQELKEIQRTEYPPLEGSQQEKLPIILSGEYSGQIWKDQNILIAKCAYLINCFALKPSQIVISSGSTLTLDDSNCYRIKIEPKSILYLMNNSLVQETLQAKDSVIVYHQSKIIESNGWNMYRSGYCNIKTYTAAQDNKTLVKGYARVELYEDTK